MEKSLIFIPVLLQIMLTLSLYILLLKRKNKSIQEGTVQKDRRALHPDAWPDSVVQVNNSITSQFQIPVLFYILCLTSWTLDNVTIISLSVASIFVLSRMVHAYVHTGSNYVPYRLKAFSTGVGMTLVLVVLTFIKILA